MSEPGIELQRGNTLVVASDCRVGAPGSALERNFGDGAAAFLIGDAEVAAAIGEVHSISDEIIDVWRLEAQPFVRQWEERFVVEHGFRDNVVAVVEQLLEKSGRGAGDFAKLAPDESVSLGLHELRGAREPVEVFTLRELV